jgi:PTH1 family peptidyl-tRNA hydrolase
VKVVVGLGNPGKEYESTRHNVGFAAVAELVRRHNALPVQRGFRSLYREARIGDERVLLLMPQTFMNLSGEAVADVCRFYKLEAADLIVILDDVALPVGQLRLRYKGSAGGHNGLANILTMLHTNEVPRVRIGVGGPSHGDLIDHVLSRFTREELPVIEDAVVIAANAVECALAEGFENAMNRFNPPKSRPSPPAT